MRNTKDIIKRRLRKLRDEKELKIREAAEQIGVTPSTYGNWEQGIRIPRYPEVESAARVFGVTPEYIVGWSDRDFKLLNGQDFICPGKMTIEVRGSLVDVRDPCLDTALSKDYLERARLDHNVLMNIYAPDDAMTGDIEKGDEVLINRGETTPLYTNIFAIMVRGSIWLRRIRPEPDSTFTLQANNKDIQPDTKVSLDDIIIIGRVIRVSRSL
jgi:transcriptional regulator with XRE-family HTH domain